MALFDIDATANEISEDAVASTSIGITAWASDPDGDSLVYMLVEDAGGRFTIDRSTGTISVAEAGLLDYETTTTHDVKIRAEDDDGAGVEIVLVVAVLDVGEPLF